jgi:phage baseplate assembly protein W
MSIDYSTIPSGTSLGTGGSSDSVRPIQGPGGGPRHLKWPLRLSDGPDGTKVFASLEQDTLEEVTQSVQLLLSTEVGERYVDAPDYGVEELLTGSPIAGTHVLTAVADFEPRAAVTLAAGRVGADGQQSVTVTVTLVEGASDVSPILDH